MAIDKARRQAGRNMIRIRIAGDTIPTEVLVKFKAARVLLRPARRGRGIVAGQTLRALAEAAGIKDLVTKVIGSTNPINIAQASMKAFAEMSRTSVFEAEKTQAEDVRPGNEGGVAAGETVGAAGGEL